MQAEAAAKVNELFPNLSRGDYLPTDLEEDLEAGFMGLRFNEPESEHEWEEQVNWDELAARDCRLRPAWAQGCIVQE